MLYPLKFKPRPKERLWGGNMLTEKLGRKLPQGRRIGESWELSALQGDLSVVANGTLKGNDVQEMVEVFMGELVGEKVYAKFGLEFPLLVKILDAGDDLSIQVHPGDETAKTRHNSYGKTELWHVMEAGPGAHVYLGFRPGVTRADYLDAVAGGTLDGLLNRIEVRQGDSFLVPAGTVHSIGAGILMAEIEQTSDITYRLFDRDRVDAKGRLRPLHLDLAEGVIDFDGAADLRRVAVARENEAVALDRNPWFATNLVEVRGEAVRDYSDLDSFVIYFCTRGRMAVGFDRGYETLSRGETLLVPAAEERISLRGEGALLEVYIDS